MNITFKNQRQAPPGMAELVVAWLSQKGILNLFLGNIEVRLCAQVRGSCHRKGRIIPKSTKNGSVLLIGQPGDNGTCWEFLLPCPPNHDAESFLALLKQDESPEGGQDEDTRPEALRAYDEETEGLRNKARVSGIQAESIGKGLVQMQKRTGELLEEIVSIGSQIRALETTRDGRQRELDSTKGQIEQRKCEKVALEAEVRSLEEQIASREQGRSRVEDALKLFCDLPTEVQATVAKTYRR